VKRVLVYIAVASVMALATAAAAAAISRRSDPEPSPRHHLTRRVAIAPVATAPVVAPGTSVAAGGPMRSAVRRLQPAPRHTRTVHRTPPLRPVRGGAPAGGQPVSAPTPPSVSAGTTVAVGTLGAGATVTAGNGGVTATAGSPVGSVGVSLGAPSHGGAPVLGVSLGGNPGP
jgi:hypothetical protein